MSVSSRTTFTPSTTLKTKRAISRRASITTSWSVGVKEEASLNIGFGDVEEGEA